MQQNCLVLKILWILKFLKSLNSANLDHLTLFPVFVHGLVPLLSKHPLLRHLIQLLHPFNIPLLCKPNTFFLDLFLNLIFPFNLKKFIFLQSMLQVTIIPVFVLSHYPRTIKCICLSVQTCFSHLLNFILLLSSDFLFFLHQFSEVLALCVSFFQSHLNLVKKI